jgi:Asp-tRNA(Asn)/Glu-tRNA(Gln) amidotransferase A subunit family amidase
MIRLPEARATDYRGIEEKLSGLGSRAGVREFYEEVIERYTRLDAKYLFSASFDKEYVFSQIDDNWAHRDRELFGIPVGVKDVFNTKVLPTAMGSGIWEGFKAGNNARVVDEIADRGGIIFSKTTTAEFAVHYIQAGKTVNPHNARHITGTSSAGSAVAVACGALPVCLGTQTAGSIVRPASFCGVFGFKPSFGAFDRTGTLKTTDTLDTIGLLGSDVYGLHKTFLSAFQKDPQYPIAKNYFERLGRFRSKNDLKIGVIAEQFSGYAAYDSYVKADFDRATGLLAAPGVEVSAVQGIGFINEIHALHQKIYCKSLSYYFQQEFSRETQMSQIMKEMIRLGGMISTKDYVDALRWQPEYRARFDALTAAYDFLITPSTASVAPAIGEQERDDTCLIWTFFGYPVLSIPAFWSSELGLPFGLQIVAPKFCDLALLEFGASVVKRLRGEPS